MQRPRRSGASLGRAIAFDVLILFYASAALGLGPRLVEAHAALEWVRYHAARGPSAPRPAENARQAARAAARAVTLAAPLPWAREAARLALGIGRGLERANRPAALLLYAEVRAALDIVTGSRWRSLGLTEVASEARSLEDAARVSPQAAKGE